MEVKPGLRKVTGGALAGAIATIAIYVAQIYEVAVPPGFEGALATLLTLGIVYFTKESYTSAS